MIRRFGLFAVVTLAACGGGSEETYSHDATRACLERDGYRIQENPPLFTPRGESALFVTKGQAEASVIVFGKDPKDGERLENATQSASDGWAAAFGTLNLDKDDVREIVQRRGNSVFWSTSDNFASVDAIRDCLSE